MSPTRYTGGGGGGVTGGTPAVIATGTEAEAALSTLTLTHTRPLGSEGEALTITSLATLLTGDSSESLALVVAAGAATFLTGSSDESITAVLLAQAMNLGAEAESWLANGSFSGVNYVTTGATSGTTAWTTPGNVTADDAAVAAWTISGGLGTSVAGSGTLTATNPTFTPPSGWTRTKVEALVHYNDAAVGLNATGDLATFSVQMQRSDGTALQTVVNDSYAAAGSHADSTVAVDVTAACAALTDAALALTKFVCPAALTVTLVSTGTRSFSINVNSIGLRVTYTRTGLS